MISVVRVDDACKSGKITILKVLWGGNVLEGGTGEGDL